MVKEYVARYYPSLLKAAGTEYARTPAAVKPRTAAWKPWVQGKIGDGSD
jgi:starch phosphorylase